MLLTLDKRVTAIILKERLEIKELEVIRPKKRTLMIKINV